MRRPSSFLKKRYKLHPYRPITCIRSHADVWWQAFTSKVSQSSSLPRDCSEQRRNNNRLQPNSKTTLSEMEFRDILIAILKIGGISHIGNVRRPSSMTNFVGVSSWWSWLGNQSTSVIRNWIDTYWRVGRARIRNSFWTQSSRTYIINLTDLCRSNRCS